MTRVLAIGTLRDLIPPLLWRLLRRLVGGRHEHERVNYQGVSCPFTLTRIHVGSFAEVHEKWAQLDTHIGRDVNVTRLRVYTVLSLAQMAVRNTRSGDFMTAGVSFGTAPLVVSECLKAELKPRKWFLIDPLDGSATSLQRGQTSYNTDFELVRGRWVQDVEAVWVREFLSSKVLDVMPEFAFVHLNTGDFDAEFSCMRTLIEKLVPGGFIIFDLYGWLAPNRQQMIDELLVDANTTSFEMVTRQLVIGKPALSLP